MHCKLATWGVLAAALLPGVVRGAEPVSNPTPDPFLGKWSLDTRASKYPDRRCPKRMVIEMTEEPRGVHYRSETEPVVGETFHVDYVGRYDGKPVVVTGDRGLLLPVTLQRSDARHVKASYSNGFSVMATSERTISDDGKTMTITTVSHNAFGQNETNIGVYRRVEAAPAKER